MDLATFCIGIHDHRIDRCKHHSVGTIMFVSLVGVICGAETWEGDKSNEIIDGYENRDVIFNRVTRHISESTGHGRLEKRICTVVTYGSIMESMFKNKFVGLKSIIGVKSERIIMSTGERTQENRYYITSLDNTNPEEISSAIRQHWSIENNLHWQLDVTFREDDSKKVKNAARNFSAVTKMALSILKNDKETKLWLTYFVAHPC